MPIGRDELAVMWRAGMLRPRRPDALLGMALQALRWGTTPAAGYAAAAARDPHGIAVIDDEGSITFREIQDGASAMARGLRACGVSNGMRVGILLRNSRWFPMGVGALAQIGADAILLNTGFSEAQVAAAARSEGVDLVIRELDGVAFFTGPGIPTVSLDNLLETAGDPVPKPKAPGRIVILTSGTTGAPKGAARSSATLGDAVSLLEAVPLRARETTIIAAPVFHAWGFAHLTLAMVLGTTVVLRKAFDPSQVVADIANHHASALIAVPVMLSRLVEVPLEELESRDLSSLRVVATSGSAIPVPVAEAFLDTYGEYPGVLYNLYGSTEAAYATVAGPEDMRAAPGTAGRPLRGVRIRILDEHGSDVVPGEAGRIFVGSSMTFGGYTDGADKPRIDGLVSTGDVGRFDAEGRLMIEGRDDDMIISGGENVFPREVEDTIAAHPDVSECAVIGVEDAEFGTRLAAYVVVRTNASLEADTVREFVRDRLARFKVPREVVFIDELPRNATGKVLKRALADETLGR